MSGLVICDSSRGELKPIKLTPCKLNFKYSGILQACPYNMGSLKWATGYTVKLCKAYIQIRGFPHFRNLVYWHATGLTRCDHSLTMLPISLLKLSHLHHKQTINLLPYHSHASGWIQWKKISCRLLEKEINFHNFSRFSIANRWHLSCGEIGGCSAGFKMIYQFSQMFLLVFSCVLSLWTQLTYCLSFSHL